MLVVGGIQLILSSTQILVEFMDHLVELPDLIVLAGKRRFPLLLLGRKLSLEFLDARRVLLASFEFQAQLVLDIFEVLDFASVRILLRL